MPELLSKAAYARHRGVSAARVSQWVKAGRLPMHGDKIDRDAADEALKAGQQQVQPVTRSAGASKRGAPDPEFAAHAKAAKHPPQDTPADRYILARAEREEAAAKKLALEAAQKAGELVEVEAVRRQAFDAARSMRDALLALPDRLAPELAAESDPHAVRMHLEREVRAMLDNLRGA